MNILQKLKTWKKKTGCEKENTSIDGKSLKQNVECEMDNTEFTEFTETNSGYDDIYALETQNDQHLEVEKLDEYFADEDRSWRSFMAKRQSQRSLEDNEEKVLRRRRQSDLMEAKALIESETVNMVLKNSTEIDFDITDISENTESDADYNEIFIMPSTEARGRERTACDNVIYEDIPEDGTWQSFMEKRSRQQETEHQQQKLLKKKRLCDLMEAKAMGGNV